MNYRYTKVDIILNDNEKIILKELFRSLQLIDGKTGTFELTNDERKIISQLIDIL